MTQPVKSAVAIVLGLLLVGLMAAALWFRVTPDSASIVIAAVSFVIAVLELRAIRKSQERSEKFRGRQRKKWVAFRIQESKRFAEPSREIAEGVARRLMDEPAWAQSALEAAKLEPYSNTLFGERSRHFQLEKQRLAEVFAPYLIDRCRRLAQASERDHVFLFIDAGSTLFPFFRILGTSFRDRLHKGETWLSRLHLATNNLPGMEQLFQSGRRDAGRYSGLAIEDCHILPGIPLPIFGAVVGKETEDAISGFRRRYSDLPEINKITFVTLMSGNWVRVPKDQTCPLPMARGNDHFAVKQAFIENSDEVYVVSPLGKIFANFDQDFINDALDDSDDSGDTHGMLYRSVTVPDSNRVKLVTTRRAEGQVLYKHSIRLRIALDPRQPLVEVRKKDFAEAPIDSTPHLFFDPDLPPMSPHQELSVEFPHVHTRINPRVLDMFEVDKSHR